MIWLEQSKSDLEGARWLLQSGPPFSALACFQSHQVVEKCLKAMLFYYCGIAGGLLGSHEVLDLASKLREEIKIPEEEDMQSVRRVAKYYLSTRYPNRQPPNVVPAEAFNKNEAEMAVDAASKVLELVDEYCLEE
jgi:HEPN domain-containing protein